MTVKGSLSLIAGILLVLLAALPARAQQTVNDLNGTWDFFAYGYYEVFTTYCYGTITVDNGAVTSGTGNYHSAPTHFGGAMGMDGSGNINGYIYGAYDDEHEFQYTILSGRMNPDRDTIVASGHDHKEWMCIYYLVRVD